MLDGCVSVCKLQNASDCLKLLDAKFRTFPEILGCAVSLQRWLTFTGIYPRPSQTRACTTEHAFPPNLLPVRSLGATIVKS